MSGSPHKSKPDLSNLLKALEDAVMVDDSAVWHYASVSKFWSYEGWIVINKE